MRDYTQDWITANDKDQSKWLETRIKRIGVGSEKPTLVRIFPQTAASLTDLYEKSPDKTSGGVRENIFVAYISKLGLFKPRAQSKLKITAPAKFLKMLARIWGLNNSQICILLGLDASEYRDIVSTLGDRSLFRYRDVKDRLRLILRIRALLSDLFRDEEVERQWLRETKEALGNKTPLELLMEGSMENLLRIKQFAEYMSGR